MKKLIALVLAMMLLLTLASCGKKQDTAPATTAAPTEAATEAATEAPAEEPTEESTEAPTEPQWKEGISRANYGEATYTTFDRGTEVTVIGSWKDYYVISGEEVDLLVETRLVRLGDEEAFKSYTGYAKYNTVVYADVYMEGEPITTLGQNKVVTVLDGKGDWLLIQWNDQTGYVEASQISKAKIKTGSGNSNSSQEGGDINLDLLSNYYGPEMEKLENTGVVLADSVKGILYLTSYAESLKVLSADEEICEVYLEGYTLKLPRWLVRMEGDDTYESWTGYSKYKAVVWEEYQMRNESKVLARNTQVKVLDELPDCYVVEIDGEIGYMDLNSAKATKYTTNGNGNTGTGSSGTGTGTSGGVWTPPAL